MMDHKGLLSVIVPVYNVEGYLNQCVESILAQTYNNFELILIDDGSTDHSGEICDSFAEKDKRIIVLHQKNAGQGAARNAGLDIARGHYIAFCDSDDYVDVCMYEKMISELELTDSQIANCGIITHSGVRNAYSKIPPKGTTWESPEEVLREYFHTRYITGNPVNKVYVKCLFDDIRFPVGVAREDVYIMHHVLGNCKKAVHVGECFYHYNIREGSSEHQDFQPKYLVSLQIADERCSYIEEQFPQLLPLAQKACYGSRLSAIKKITRSHAQKEYRKEYDELIGYIKENEAPTSEYATLRSKILYFPVIYQLEMDYRYKWRKKIKKMLLSFLGK